MKRWQKYLEQNGTSSGVLAMLAALDHIEEAEPQVVKSIEQELTDQRSYLKLIASENYTSLAVQLAMGNLLTDKYAEGFAHHRFYAGCDNVDSVEDLAEQELLKLFGADAAYVQPHSGADANLVAFFAILSKNIELPDLNSLSNAEWAMLRGRLVNQKMMGMSLDSGGHLTHGFRHNISGKLFESIPYSVDPKTGLLDYAALEKHVLEEKPLILMAGYSAYPRRLNFAKMREIADSVGATLVVDMAHFAGLVAGKVFTGEYDPIPFAHLVTTTTHKTLRGPRGGMVLCQKEYAEVIDKGCPLVLGGPMPHVMAAKAVAFKEALTPEFKTYAQAVVDNA
ncbi:MAG: glycine hydroxymethyltransferase, partial [Chlamydiia bacterium]|nr:glycine hydroxymethyltransferase [Chlamydiia bacterium]